jgi:hypothetical protein
LREPEQPIRGTMVLTVADDPLDHIAEKLIAAGR